MAKYRFTKFVNTLDESMIFYALESGGVRRQIDDEMFIEVTTDFKTAHMVREESLKPIGVVEKEY